MNNNNYEREIDFKGLFFRVMYGWRSIIILAFIIALLCGGYKFVSGIRTLNDKTTIESQEAEYQVAQSDYDTLNAILQKEIVTLKTSIESRMEYNNKSILMQINPFDEQVANVSYYVATDDQQMLDLTSQNIDLTDMVVGSYFSLAKNGEMYNFIYENLSTEIDLRYLKEILTVWCEYDSNVLNIRVIHSDKTVGGEIITLARKYLEEAQESIKEKIGEHSLTVLSESSMSIVDLSREKAQKRSLQTVEDNKNSLKEKQVTLLAMSPPMKSVTSKSLIVENAIKFSILGLFIGAFFVMAIIALLFMMSDKLLDMKDLRLRYSLRVLGKLEKPTKKRLFGFIDRWLNKLDSSATVKIAEEEEVERICSNLIIVLKAEDIPQYNIMITGTAKIEKIESIYKKVSAEFSDKSYKFLYSGNISDTTKTIVKIADCDAVIIVEEVGCSTYTEITKELENIKDLGKKVIGAVLI